MDDITKMLLGYAILPVILGIGAYVMKSIHSRLDMIERTLPEKLSEPSVRQIVSDKVDPIREDIQELKIKLDRITELLMKSSH